MSSDLRDALTAAAQANAPEPDLDAAWRRGLRLRHQRTRRIVFGATLGVGLAIAGAVFAFNAGESRISVRPANGTQFTDSERMFSVDVPAGWHRAGRALVQNPGPSEFELLAVSTHPIPTSDTGSSCTQYPDGAVEALGPSDALVYVIEGLSIDGPRGVEVQTPADIRDRPTRFKSAPFLAGGCTEPPRVADRDDTVRHIYFSDHERVIGVFIAWGTDVSAARRDETWRLLESLRFEALPPGPRSRDYHDDLNGFSVTVPGDWVQEPTDPIELLGVMTPERTNEVCGSTTNAAFMTMHELNIKAFSASLPTVSPRPETFGPTSGSTEPAAGPLNINGCEAPSPPTQNIFFSDGERGFQVMIRFYPEATPERRQQAYDILNSMRFTPESELQRGRPANEVHVFLLNGSGHPTAVATAAEQLSHFGYVVAGSRKAPSIVPLTTVTCVSRFKDDTEPLARVLGSDTRAKSSPRRTPDRIKHAECIVTLGKNAPFSMPGNAPQMVSVAVLNGSSKPGAANIAAAELRGLGYEIVAATNTAAREGTIVSCRRKFAVEATTLRNIIAESTVEKYPDPTPPEARDADCIVILGD